MNPPQLQARDWFEAAMRGEPADERGLSNSAARVAHDTFANQGLTETECLKGVVGFLHRQLCQMMDSEAALIGKRAKTAVLPGLIQFKGRKGREYSLDARVDCSEVDPSDLETAEILLGEVQGIRVSSSRILTPNGTGV